MVKRFIFYDSPHLTKSIRNILEKYDINVKVEVASWKDIETFYEKDKMKPIRIARKLTDTHIKLNGFEKKMKVKYSTQIMNRTDVSGVSFYFFKHCPLKQTGQPHF